MSEVLVLPTPLSTNSFALGQLLNDPLSSKSISFQPSQEPAHSKPQTQSNYKDIISHDEEGRFISSLGETTSLVDNLVVLSADEMSFATLTNPSAAFDALRRDTETQSFLRKSALLNQPLYFVTGIQKLKNASYRRSPANGASTIKATEHQIQLPMHVRRRDSAELETEEEDVRESVFAVQLMKVASRCGPKDEPHSLEDIEYTWTYHALEETDMQLSIGLGNALQAKELRALAGIVLEEDFEQVRYEHYFDDEGLAGFSSD